MEVLTVYVEEFQTDFKLSQQNLRPNIFQLEFLKDTSVSGWTVQTFLVEEIRTFQVELCEGNFTTFNYKSSKRWRKFLHFQV